MSTVASQVAFKHGVDVSQDFVYLLMDARVKISRDLLFTRLESVSFVQKETVEMFFRGWHFTFILLVF